MNSKDNKEMTKFCMKLLTFLVVAIGLCSTVSANEFRACAKYQRADYSWSHGYKITGFVVKGDDLNEIANTFKYSVYRNYFVIPWKKGGYTALELNSYEDEPPIIEREYRDQRQRNWRLKNGWDWCN